MNKKHLNKSSYFARILFAISFVLLGYGFFLDYQEDHKFIDPIKDVVAPSDSNGSTVHIDTSDSEKPTENKGDKTTSKDSNSATNTNSGSNSTGKSNNTGKTNNNSNNNANNNPVITPDNKKQDPVPTPTPAPAPTIDDINNQLRIEIQNTYDINVRYGGETAGYSVSGIATYPIGDGNVVNNQLNQLKNTLNLYPRGLFREIKNGGIPLTVMLVERYADNTITGVTDSSYSNAIISISAAHDFGESFYHESYHYIERYLFKRGANFNSWDSLNPPEFAGWGIIDGNLSYSNTFSPSAPFVNNYAQTDAAEDRASTFEYMMAPSKASCLNNGNIVWRKAKLMADTMDLVLSTIAPNVTEYWERYL